MERLAFRIFDPELKTFHYSGSTPSMLAGYFKMTATLVTVHGMKHQQSAGRIDKNGREIYRGDLVTHDDFIPGTVMQVVWDEYWGHWLIKNGWDDLLYKFKDLEVVGNIYEHKHLLGTTP